MALAVSRNMALAVSRSSRSCRVRSCQPIIVRLQVSALSLASDGVQLERDTDVLSSASAVWRERILLAGTLSPPPRAQESCTAEEIRAFVSVILALTHEAQAPASELPVETLLLSLPLIHKYDCKGAKMMLDDMDALHFPDGGTKKVSGILLNCSWAVPQGTEGIVTSPWLTQKHIDYLLLKQELYGSDSKLTEKMKQLLVKLLTTKKKTLYDGQCFDFVPGQAYIRSKESYRGQAVAHLMVTLQLQEPAQDTQEPRANLVLASWRLTSYSFNALVPLLPSCMSLADF
eukprot:7382600-Prymnesium_polylepis.3